MVITSQMTKRKFIDVNFILMLSRTYIRVSTGVVSLLLIAADIASVIWPDLCQNRVAGTIIPIEHVDQKQLKDIKITLDNHKVKNNL